MLKNSKTHLQMPDVLYLNSKSNFHSIYCTAQDFVRTCVREYLKWTYQSVC